MDNYVPETQATQEVDPSLVFSGGHWTQPAATISDSPE